MKTPINKNEGHDQQSCENAVQLAAFEDRQLTDEAVQQLIAIRNDNSRPLHKGKDLPSISRVDLLNQLEEEVE
jgi:hypothetical protein